MNVDDVDRYPYLADEVQWIQTAVASGMPVLGICLGSQLLAKALGARVYPNGTKEIGWYSIELTPAAADDILFGACQPTETVFQWHGDTFDLPAGAVLMASSAACRHQAFRFGRSAYGLQFHLEVSAEMIESWLTEPENCCEIQNLDYIDPHEIRAQMPANLPGLQRLADRVFGQFVAMCRDGAGEAPLHSHRVVTR
jgi:GMP synthase-like glutamine amidotransferase